MEPKVKPTQIKSPTKQETQTTHSHPPNNPAQSPNISPPTQHQTHLNPITL